MRTAKGKCIVLVSVRVVIGEGQNEIQELDSLIDTKTITIRHS